MNIFSRQRTLGLIAIVTTVLFAVTAFAATQTNYSQDDPSRQFSTSIKEAYGEEEAKDIQISFTNVATNSKPAGYSVLMQVDGGEAENVLPSTDPRTNRIVNLGELTPGDHTLRFTIPDGCGNFYGFSGFSPTTRFDNEYDCQYVRTLTVNQGDLRGCTERGARNYDPNATIDDGSCIYRAGEGCTDQSALNYNPRASIENGSCIYDDSDIEGCTDSRALNYNPRATINDGSCRYEPGEVTGCTTPTAPNYNPNATIDDGSCITGIPGCTDSVATNYNQRATVNDGSCVYPPGVGPSTFECSVNNSTWFECEGRTFTLRDPGVPIYVRTDPADAGTWSDWCTGDINNGVSANFGPVGTAARFDRNARVTFDFAQEGKIFDMTLCLDPSSPTRANSWKNIKLKLLNMDFRET